MNVIHHSPSVAVSESQNSVFTKNYFERIMQCGIFINFLLGILYLILSNALATRCYVLDELKQDSLALKSEIEGLDIEIAITTSLYAIQSSEQVQEMPFAKNKRFLIVEKQNMAFLNLKQQNSNN